MPDEEVRLERQAEEPLDTDLARVLDQRLEQAAAEAGAELVGRDGEGADLGEVLPHDVEGAAADDATVEVGDPELLEALEVGHGLLADEHPALGEGGHEGPDGADVGGAGAPDHRSAATHERFPSRKSAKRRWASAPSTTIDCWPAHPEGPLATPCPILVGLSRSGRRHT